MGGLLWQSDTEAQISRSFFVFAFSHSKDSFLSFYSKLPKIASPYLSICVFLLNLEHGVVHLYLCVSQEMATISVLALYVPSLC